MNLTEIKRWSLSEPPDVQQIVGELVGMVERLEASNKYYANQWVEDTVARATCEARRQAFLDAAEMAENEYTGPGHNLASTRAICFVISEALRQQAERGKNEISQEASGN